MGGVSFEYGHDDGSKQMPMSFYTESTQDQCKPTEKKRKEKKKRRAFIFLS